MSINKILLLMLSLFCINLSVNSQLLIQPNGKAKLGVDLGLDEDVSELNRDTLTMLKVYGPGDYSSRARISFGDAASVRAMNVMVGEAGTTDTDQLWLHGKRGLYYTANSLAQDTVMYYDRNLDAAFHFNCDVKSSGVFVASDSRFKENVEPIQDVLSQLSMLEPVSYNLKSDLFGNPNTTKSSGLFTKDKDLLDDANDVAVAKQKQSESFRYGFIAQQLQEIFPDLVHTDATGYMYVDYIGLIPILVQSINELQTEVSDLRGKLSQKINSNTNSGGTGTSELAESLVKATLNQNTPNPFNDTTVISYSLPETIQRADIYIYDLNGHQVMNIPVVERGYSSVTINGGSLSAGMYIYSLIADGQEIGSHRMILTK